MPNPRTRHFAYSTERGVSGSTSNRWHLLAPEVPSRRQGEAPTLGVFPEVSLAEARERRAAARKLLAAGQDPSEANKIEKRARRLQAENSFEALAREWHDAQLERWNKDHAAKVLKSLQDNALSVLGDRPIAEIAAPELLDVLRMVERRGALEIAHKVSQRYGAIFRYGIATGRCERDVAADLRGALKTRKVTHMAALSRDDLPTFLRALEAYTGDRRRG